ncbi:MAG: class I SAM-dependent methyltransferase [Hyphomicrobium sp.]
MTREASIVSSCRLCGGQLGPSALNLGMQPISNRLPQSRDQAIGGFYPLSIVLCSDCGLAQLQHHLDPSEHFHDDYVYRSGMSTTWISHCEDYARELTNGYGVTADDTIIEIGSNDGTLLKAFKERGARVHGVDPSANVAAFATNAGVETTVAFFNSETADALRARYGRVKAIIGNNVLAHVPDIANVLQAGNSLISDDGFLCFEFPHFVNIIERRYFDTIYHEHYSYLGVSSLQQWAARNGMVVFDVQRQNVHGGSLRVFLRRGSMAKLPDHVAALIEAEQFYLRPEPWQQLEQWISDWRRQFVELLQARKRAGRRVVGYPAASKTTVALNFLGAGTDLIAYCCDASPLKQGRFIPGVGVPILPPQELQTTKADTIIVFAWNIYDEIVGSLSKLVDYPVEIIQTLPELRIRTLS